MSLNYAPAPSLEVMHCFLTTTEEHERIMVELNYTILFTSMDGAPPPSPTFSRYLQIRYGGVQSNWEPVLVKNSFLLKVPDWADQDYIEGDSGFWEEHLALKIVPWQTQNRSDPLPVAQHVHLTIHNFPLDYWHPKYFRQDLTGIGCLIGVSQEGLRGSNKLALVVMIECFDLNLIPRVLRVGHGYRRTDCCIDRHEGWANNSSDSPAQPPGGDSYPRFTASRVLHRKTVMPYIPPWRRRALHEQISRPD